MQVSIEKSWKAVLENEFKSAYFEKLAQAVKHEYRTQTVYPPASLIFNAFNSTPFTEVKVVILGQDPYHGAGQAHGLSFSVLPPTPPPPSLLNIFKEIEDDLNIPIRENFGDLTQWAKQGVFLLNAILSVRAGAASSHKDIGWLTFTDKVIQTLSEQKEGLVFLLWGKFAQGKAALIDTTKHLILTTTHPSPFSAHYGFLGCRHFSNANAYLENKGLSPIDWRL